MTGHTDLIERLREIADADMGATSYMRSTLREAADALAEADTALSRKEDAWAADFNRLAAELATQRNAAKDGLRKQMRTMDALATERDRLATELAQARPDRETFDYLTRTIETIRNHRDADNCWPQWANRLADEVERMWAVVGDEIPSGAGSGQRRDCGGTVNARTFDADWLEFDDSRRFYVGADGMRHIPAGINARCGVGPLAVVLKPEEEIEFRCGLCWAAGSGKPG